MADHVLNTRIKLKYDTYANWLTNNPVLLEGEIAIATIPAGTTVETSENTTMQHLPNVVIKVGQKNGQGELQHYADLPFVSALAADVYEWAKKADKPTYGYTEITGLEDELARVSAAADTDTQYQLVEIGTNSYKFELQSKEKSATEWTKVSDLDLSGIISRIEALETHATTYSAKVDTLVGEDAGKSVRTIAAEEAAKKDEAIAAAAAAAKAAQDDVDAVEEDLGNIDELGTEHKTTVVGAINEVLTTVGNNATAAKVTMTTNDAPEGALKSYTLKQGDTNIGTIDIPKDMVVESGEVVVDPEGQAAGTYIKLKLANVTEPLYINVGTLVDIYKAQANAAQVQVTVDNSTREISAAIVAGSVDTAELKDNAVKTDKIADENVTKTKLSAAVQASLDKADASATQTDMDAAEGRLEVIEAQLTDIGDDTVVSKIAAAEQAAKDYADDQIDALKIEDYLKKADAPGYADILTKTEAQTTYAPISHEHEIAHVKGLQDALDAKANDADLAAIAKTGSTDDLVQGTKTLIFDCGSSVI